ncbi:MAG TPA: class I SAM-dependent methyltransferase [Blastocatellia bacterium]|nr:class I SAM-dependent methyltransferase [Blastocatellia bacterium]
MSRALRRCYERYGPNRFLRFAPPGHFYSPLPDMRFIDRYQAALFNRQISSVPGIENNVEEQLALVARFSDYYDELPFKDDKSAGLRYYFRNPYFSYGDAIILYSMLRHYRPQKIIEVGSGFSSALMLDTNDLFFSKRMALTFIEPHPERLFSLLNDEDKKQHETVIDIVQDVQFDRFAALNARDILFIDSSHVAKIGSDVVHLLTNVLPQLNTGVIIHFHDVFWPFEYPEEWVRDGIAWNENYMLKAFLQFNAHFKILFFNSYLAIHHRDLLEQKLPLFLKNTGGSLWLEKVS